METVESVGFGKGRVPDGGGGPTDANRVDEQVSPTSSLCGLTHRCVMEGNGHPTTTQNQGKKKKKTRRGNCTNQKRG